ncbi:MAG: hypothetical protein KAR21_06100 [Spirochaetales bacterium]|nr:hypothetical protein [Spirochaetales bacterium]
MGIVTKKLYFAILILLLFFLLASSCKRGEDSDKTASVDSDAIIESEGQSTLVFGADREKTKSAVVDAAEKSGFTETEAGDIKGQLFPINSVEIIPEDMVIGPLEDMNMLDIPSGSFVDSIITFFRGARKGEIVENILHPTWSGSIIRLYKDSIFEINYTVRIGTIINKNGIRTANIRLISDKGRVSGDIMADNYEGKWLLSSISIDMNQLENVYFRENLEFTPLSYSNILLNY